MTLIIVLRIIKCACHFQVSALGIISGMAFFASKQRQLTPFQLATQDLVFKTKKLHSGVGFVLSGPSETATASFVFFNNFFQIPIQYTISGFRLFMGDFHGMELAQKVSVLFVQAGSILFHCILN